MTHSVWASQFVRREGRERRSGISSLVWPLETSLFYCVADAGFFRRRESGGGGEGVDDFLENDWLIFFRTAIMKFLSSTENRDDHTYQPYT